MDQKGLEKLVAENGTALHKEMESTFSKLEPHIPSNPEADKLKEVFKMLMEGSKLKYQDTQAKSITDLLTGLTNRAGFEQAFEKHQKRYEAHGDNGSINALQNRKESFTNKYALLMTDADKFKNVNDILGHLVGDTVLKEMANLIKETTQDTIKNIIEKSIRPYDETVARYGGEEKIVVLYGTCKKGGKIVAERIRKEVEANLKTRIIDYLDKNNISYNKRKLKKAKFTVSIGVAEGDLDKDVKEVIKKADDCLYNAKKYGRNIVVVDGENPADKLDYSQKFVFGILGGLSKANNKIGQAFDRMTSLYSQKCCPALRS